MNFIHRNQPDFSWVGELDRYFNPGRSIAAHQTIEETIHETPASWVIRLDVPGFAKQHITLKVTGQTLQLTGEASADGPFAKKVNQQWKLGTRIDQANVRANLENGVLEITLPKIEAPEPRNIEIN